MASPEPHTHAPEEHARENRRRDRRRRALTFALVFAAAFGVRLLCWRDVRFEAYKVQTAVTENYRQMARLLLENGASSFYDPGSPTSEPDLLGHPPGYPFVLAAVYAVCGESDAAAQGLQAACDALPATGACRTAPGHLRDTDAGLTQLEASEAARPEYAAALFKPDGIERDRQRTRRALKVIRENPVWFAGVILRRAGSMLRLERTPLSTNAPVSKGWRRAPRLVVRAVQKLFITAVFLPLYLAGLALLLRERRKRELAALLTVPLYFLCAQSALHKEYRYVLAVHYLLFIVAAFALERAWLAVQHALFNRASP